MIDESLTEYLPFFEEQNLGIICASVHCMGLLTNSGPQPWHPADDNIKKVCKEAAELAKENNTELGKLALYYALQFDGPATFLVGMQNETLLNMNLDVYYNGLNDKELKLMELLKEK